MFKEIIVRSPTFDPSRPSESSVSFLLIIAERYPYAVDSGLTPSSALLLLISILAACFTIGVTSSGRSRQRAAQAWAAFNLRKKHVFASPHVPWCDKALLFDSLVATTLFYGSGTWPEPTGTLRSMACQMLRPRFTHARRHGNLGTSQVFFLSSGCQALRLICTYIACANLLSCIVLRTSETMGARSLGGCVVIRTTADLGALALGQSR